MTSGFFSPEGAKYTRPMRIVIERTGGVANLRRTATIDLAALPPDEAAAWERLVRESDFFNQPATFPNPPGADAFQYRVTVEADGKEHTVRVPEGQAPPRLAPLIERLNDALKPGKG
jgi:hypothetical protein